MGSQPRADPHRPFRQQALAWANLSARRTLRRAASPDLRRGQSAQSPTQERECSIRKAKSISSNDRELTIPIRVYHPCQHYRNQHCPQLPPLSAYVPGNDRGFHNPEDKFNAVELIWYTGAHGTVVSEDLLSSEFRNNSTHPIHDPYWNETGVKVSMMGKSVFRLQSCGNCICLVVPSSIMPKECIGIFLGKKGAIDRIIYKSVPRTNRNARGEELPPTVWGNIVVDEYIDIFICQNTSIVTGVSPTLI